MEQLLRKEREWGLGDDGAGPSLKLWEYMEAATPEEWDDAYARKREHFPWGVSCPWCQQHHEDYSTDICQHCARPLIQDGQ